MDFSEWLMIGGLLLIFLLAGYAAWLWYQVWRRRQQRMQQTHERNQRLAGDIRLLARGLCEGQVPPIEGAIRIKVLLDNYDGPRRANLNLAIFETIYDATAHIPTHESWKALPAAQRRQHEEYMETLEQQHRDALHRAAQELRSGLI
ncbi:DUF2489 domain-containing protein [Halopseudomonas pertucinogena]|uniref:DUF2489 domain-containing protein n=1 Tax=Halopseudomonas pertucinogena TaxID=86175 RepID=A0ABQ2CKX8_9GAMM|nr:DUF2489 domain-containing protein [Halopseudomonas pertucinogena]GGI90812.1 hypothetical protein GCM10009083_04000 [Halopseudomonas pertucinogena]